VLCHPPPEGRRFCSDRRTRHHSDRHRCRVLEISARVSLPFPDGRLLARLALLRLACPSCPRWEAASRFAPQSADALSFGGGVDAAFFSAMLRRSTSMRFATFWRPRRYTRDTGRPACFFLSIATTLPYRGPQTARGRNPSPCSERMWWASLSMSGSTFTSGMSSKYSFASRVSYG